MKWPWAALAAGIFCSALANAEDVLGPQAAAGFEAALRELAAAGDCPAWSAVTDAQLRRDSVQLLASGRVIAVLGPRAEPPWFALQWPASAPPANAKACENALQRALAQQFARSPWQPAHAPSLGTSPPDRPLPPARPPWLALGLTTAVWAAALWTVARALRGQRSG